MANGRRSGRAIRLALRTRPLQSRKAAVSGAASSAAVSSRRPRPSAAWMRPLAARYAAEPADPQEPVEGVADAQRAELPGLLEQPLHAPAEAQDRDHEKEESDDAEACVRAGGRREDVRDRLGAASRQLVTVDDAVGRALPPELRGHRARDDRQRDRRGERGGGQRDRAVESRDLLKPVDDAEHELGPQPERQRPHDALAIHVPLPVGLGGIIARHGYVLSDRAAARRRIRDRWGGAETPVPSGGAAPRCPPRPARRAARSPGPGRGC